MTMIELAKELKLSQSTVSLVLNNRDHKRINPETARRVREKAAELGFRPNVAAADLRRQRSSVIGIALPSTLNPYHAALAYSLHNEFVHRKFRPMFSFFETDEEQQAATEFLLAGNIALLVTGEPRWLPSPCPIPVVSFSFAISGIDSLLFDYQKTAELTLRYLCELGHRRIAWLGMLQEPRHHWLTEYAAAADIDYCVVSVAQRTLDYSSGFELADLLLEKYKGNLPTALIVHNDPVAIGVIRRLHERGFSVPGDFSVIGQDNLDGGRCAIPSLTTVTYETPGKIAARLAEMAVARLDRPEPTSVKNIVVPPELVIRESCRAITS